MPEPALTKLATEVTRLLMDSKTRNTLLRFFLLLKGSQLLLLALPIPVWDNSQLIHPLAITSYSWINSTLNKLIRWDAVYFSSLFTNGPQYEHEWVFGPLWVQLVRLVGGSEPVFTAIIIGNFLHWISVVVLYRLTEVYYGGKFALRTAILFIWSAQGIFMTAPYSENLATTLSLLGLLFRAWQEPKYYIISTLFFTGAFWTRSNTLVLGAVYLYDFLILGQPLALLSGIILGVGSLCSLIPPYLYFCPGRPWCDSLVPSLYSYAQHEYWNVGLFHYWTLGNLPNFLVALPSIYLQCLSIHRFWNEHRALCLANTIFLLMIICLAHVQIVIRVSGFLPLAYWYLSEEVGHRRAQGWVYYQVCWSLLGSILYGAFLPPA